MKWYHNGCRTLDDLVDGKGGVKLTYGQQIGIQFYEGIGRGLRFMNDRNDVAEHQSLDLNVRMPRREAKAIFELIKPIGAHGQPPFRTVFMHLYSSIHRPQTLR